MNHMSPVQILIVDDHQLVIDGIKSMLNNETAYAIAAEANDGQHALNIIASNPDKYSLMITDISMPLLSGIDLCKMVKADFPHIKVLMLSMYNSQTVVKEAISAEADGYLLKNTGKEELLLALHRITQDGTYFSQDILPIIYGQYKKEKLQEQELSILSTREKEVLSLIVKEHTSEEIAGRLFISKKTVDNHRTNMLEKCNCKTTIGLVKYAIRNGLA